MENGGKRNDFYAGTLALRDDLPDDSEGDGQPEMDGSCLFASCCIGQRDMHVVSWDNGVFGIAGWDLYNNPGAGNHGKIIRFHVCRIVVQ